MFVEGHKNLGSELMTSYEISTDKNWAWEGCGGRSVPVRVLDDVLAAEGEDPVAGIFPEGATVLEDGLPAGEERLSPGVDDGQVPLLMADDRLQILSLPAGVRRGEEAAEGSHELVLRGLAEALVIDAENAVKVAATRRIEGDQAKLVKLFKFWSGLTALLGGRKSWTGLRELALATRQKLILKSWLNQEVMFQRMKVARYETLTEVGRDP